jgi:aryl-alcohol dehydrogenase-like predicted oxidoreductase
VLGPFPSRTVARQQVRDGKPGEAGSRYDPRAPAAIARRTRVPTYSNLGRSGLKVSPACLGAMNFGTSPTAPCDEAEGQRIVDAFLDAGHNFIDTANVYTGGESESVVGRAVASKRDSVVIATKGRGAQGPGPNDVGTSRVHLTRALEASLRRLGTDHVDLYQVHSWDPDTPIEETMDTLDGFVRSGKVRYIGCSNYTGSQIVEAQWAAARANGTPFVSLQPRYSLIARDIEADVLPAAQRHGLGAMVYSPLGGGVLTGKYERGAEPPADTRLGRRRGAGAMVLTDRTLDLVDEVKKIAADLGTTPTAVSLAWVRARRGVTSVIIGPRTLDQLRDNLPGFDLELDADVVSRLNDASRPAGRRGPG